MNILIHIPHDGNIFPEELKSSILIAEEQLKYYHKQMSDLYLNHIAEKWLNYPIISFPISRLFCDVERLTHDEPMEKFGMGICYTNTYDGLLFKNKNDEIIKKTKKYYDEHHKKLDKMAVSLSKPTLLIDLHSFNPAATRKELLTQDGLPDICIGYDTDYCTYDIYSKAIKTFSDAGYKVQENYPYKGSLIPNYILNSTKKPPLQSIMIEINQNCYIDKSRFEIPKECIKLGRTLSEFCNVVSNY